ncbi:MAG: hypothetical protein U9N72_12805, partial [Bacteroidota bacterium]|nr:hypothetical protein [Bacteroidota bacterium]
IGKELLDYASRLGVNYQVNRIYDTGNRVTEVVNNNDTLIYRFYGRPDLQVFLDDYIDLPTMQEVFHELVPGVVLRREGEGATLLFTNEPGAERLSGPEAVFLDGVIIDDPSFIAGLDPDLIERIDVIKGQYQISSMIINGIISISSFEGDMCGFDYPGAGLITSSTILEKEHKYNNFTYSDRLPQDSHIPDFRNTLYWNPELKPDDEGLIEFTFYTSDFLSEYVITIQGLTGNYVPLYYTGTIKVTR